MRQRAELGSEQIESRRVHQLVWRQGHTMVSRETIRTSSLSWQDTTLDSETLLSFTSGSGDSSLAASTRTVDTVTSRSTIQKVAPETIDVVEAAEGAACRVKDRRLLLGSDRWADTSTLTGESNSLMSTVATLHGHSGCAHTAKVCQARGLDTTLLSEDLVNEPLRRRLKTTTLVHLIVAQVLRHHLVLNELTSREATHGLAVLLRDAKLIRHYHSSGSLLLRRSAGTNEWHLNFLAYHVLVLHGFSADRRRLRRLNTRRDVNIFHVVFFIVDTKLSVDLYQVIIKVE